MRARESKALSARTQTQSHARTQKWGFAKISSMCVCAHSICTHCYCWVVIQRGWQREKREREWGSWTGARFITRHSHFYSGAWRFVRGTFDAIQSCSTSSSSFRVRSESKSDSESLAAEEKELSNPQQIPQRVHTYWFSASAVAARAPSQQQERKKERKKKPTHPPTTPRFSLCILQLFASFF